MFAWLGAFLFISIYLRKIIILSDRQRRVFGKGVCDSLKMVRV